MRSRQHRLEKSLGGKAYGYDDCHNLDRLARLPGTVDLPNATKRAAGRVASLAGNVETFPDNTCSFDELPKAAVPGIYDGDAPSIIGPKDQVDDLNELSLSDRTRQIIEHGRIGRETKAKDDTGSVWRFDGLCSMFRKG